MLLAQVHGALSSFDRRAVRHGRARGDGEWPGGGRGRRAVARTGWLTPDSEACSPRRGSPRRWPRRCSTSSATPTGRAHGRLQQASCASPSSGSMTLAESLERCLSAGIRPRLGDRSARSRRPGPHREDPVRQRPTARPRGSGARSRSSSWRRSSSDSAGRPSSSRSPSRSRAAARGRGCARARYLRDLLVSEGGCLRRRRLRPRVSAVRPRRLFPAGTLLVARSVLLCQRVAADLVPAALQCAAGRRPRSARPGAGVPIGARWPPMPTRRSGTPIW